MIKIEKKLIVWESVTCKGIEPYYLGIDVEDVDSYAEKFPFPYSQVYSLEDLKNDLQTDSLWTLPIEMEAEPEVLNWIENFLNAHL